MVRGSGSTTIFATCEAGRRRDSSGRFEQYSASRHGPVGVPAIRVLSVGAHPDAFHRGRVASRLSLGPRGVAPDHPIHFARDYSEWPDRQALEDPHTIVVSPYFNLLGPPLYEEAFPFNVLCKHGCRPAGWGIGSEFRTDNRRCRVELFSHSSVFFSVTPFVIRRAHVLQVSWERSSAYLRKHPNTYTDTPDRARLSAAQKLSQLSQLPQLALFVWPTLEGSLASNRGWPSNPRRNGLPGLV